MSVSKPGIGTDCHNLFAADQSINSTRRNLYFDYSKKDVIDNSPADGYDKYTLCKIDGDSWEPPDISKGVVARACFYMACIYHSEGLNLNETGNKEFKQMGKLSTLLKWNNEFLPTEWEKTRNNVIESYQGNRNPFIDNPDIANQIKWS